ncbi:unnamed protein product [Nippostrongylus brasiliensis]|uniref:Olfactomedin-like domain-containing protein n=1 Tax=Nippostrongylus brasiliensis TaxID=27835 RepID=A0A0N4Y1F4_NIPBR|nr:unnamed protein product [Nippostrongylus brasiliensis]
MWKSTVPWLSVLACAVIIVVQRTTITKLQAQLHSTVRTKRSADAENVVFLPLFAQISRKAMHRMCLRKRYSGFDMATLETTETTLTSTGPRPPVLTTLRNFKQYLPKAPNVNESIRSGCSSEVTFSKPQLFGIRPNHVGAAMRDGHAYYVTEFDLGYSILAFPSARSLNHSEPKAIFTLPYPFHGTDNTVFNGTAYYSYSERLIAYNLKTGETKELQLNASAVSMLMRAVENECLNFVLYPLYVGLIKTPLYNNSNSHVDVQADEHGIWALYRRKGEKFLTASRIQPLSLTVLSSWSLPAILPERFCNALIRCGLLYAIERNADNVMLSAVYDFYAHIYVNGRRNEWSGLTTLSSAQYDPNSKSITVFDNGRIYEVSAA